MQGFGNDAILYFRYLYSVHLSLSKHSSHLYLQFSLKFLKVLSVYLGADDSAVCFPKNRTVFRLSLDSHYKLHGLYPATHITPANEK